MNLEKLQIASDYLKNCLIRYPNLFEVLKEDLETQRVFIDFNFLKIIPTDFLNEAELAKELRIFKHYQQCRLISAFLHNFLSTEDFCATLSNLAQSIVSVALDWHYENLAKKFGKPLNDKKEEFNLGVIAMGKLGGKELNFSSDIDLIFCYQCDGQSSLGRENVLFFRKLAQKFINCLDNVSEDGFLYRVDTRLRPFGHSGSLVLSFDSMENYYQNHGRDWERYALMKASPLAGDIEGVKNLLGKLKPFIYRRYLDYAALKSISDMKESINNQIKSLGLEFDIKLGMGGIREAEFSVQAMQMVYGGQYPQLRETNFLKSLENLEKTEFWTAREVKNLKDAYLLLRSVENALQFHREKQLHQLPQTVEEWKVLALACNFSSKEELKKEINLARDIIHDRFRRIFANFEAPSKSLNPFYDCDFQNPDFYTIKNVLVSINCEGQLAAEIAQMTIDFSKVINWAKFSEETVKKLLKIIPLALEIFVRESAKPLALTSLFKFILEILEKDIYLGMMIEEPSLIRRLFEIAQNSAWLMNFITNYPLVLDDVFNHNEDKEDLKNMGKELEEKIKDLEGEEWLETLREFKNKQIFKIAWEEIHGKLPLMIASDYLTQIAELVINKVYEKAYQELLKRYGVPRCKGGEVARFAIIAYGKLGGLEFGYHSDVDLVFIYDDKRTKGETDGEKSIANQMFFTKLVQKIGKYLGSASANGSLYSLDNRLRPSGALPATSLEAFIEYQKNSAWTWEHQALVRARAIGGDFSLIADFEEVRKEILSTAPKENLRAEVLEMRQKMLEQNNFPSNKFHLKKSKGGLVDIEFIVQYLLLKNAHKEGVLIKMSDNIRQLAALEATGILSSMEAMTLRDAYRSLRSTIHRITLNKENRLAELSEWQEIQSKIRGIWDKVFSK